MKRWVVFLLVVMWAWAGSGAGLLSCPGTLENVTPSPIRGLVAYWNFDGNSLSNDIAPNSFTTLTPGSGTNHLTMVGAVGTETGIIGKASAFTNGVGNYWRIASANSTNMAQQGSNYLSSMAWVYQKDKASVTMGLWGKGQSASSASSWISYFLSTSSKYKEPVFATSSNGASQVIVRPGNVFTSNTWRQIFVTFDGLAAINNQWVNATNYTNIYNGYPTLHTSTRVFQIGNANDSSSQTLEGNMDEVAVWSGSRGGLSKTLTAAEINFLYNGGKGRRFPFNSGGNE